MPKLAKAILDQLKISTEVLRAARTQKDVLDFLVRFFEKNLEVDRVRIYVKDVELDALIGARANANLAKDVKKVIVPLFKNSKKPAWHKKLLKGKPFFANPVKEVSAICREQLPNLQKMEVDQRVLYFPIVTGDSLLGLIGVDNQPSGRQLELSKMELVMPLVNHTALVLHRVLSDKALKKDNRELEKKVEKATEELREKNEQLKFLASHDSLTGMPNRRNFEKVVQAKFEKATEKNQLVLVMMDIDYLKHINDTKGHLAGDRAIKRLGKYLQSLRSVDYAARYAGDEFVLLLKKEGLKTRKTLQRISQEINQKLKIQVSMGAASYPADYQTDQPIRTTIDLIRYADDALYHAKHTGRNRFVSACEVVNLVSAEERKKTLTKIEEGKTDAADQIWQLEVVSQIAESLQSSRSLPEIRRSVLRIFRKEIGFKRIRIYEPDFSGEKLVCNYAVGIASKLWTKLSRPIIPHTSVAVDSMLDQRVIAIDDARKSPLVDKKNARLFKFKSVLAIPLVLKGNAIGVLMADYDAENFFVDEEKKRFFLTIGFHIAMAIEQVRMLTREIELNKTLEKKVVMATRQLRKYSTNLENKIEEVKTLREEERRAHFDMISALVASLESKDSYTRGHSMRVANLAQNLATELGYSGEKLRMIRYAALLHDLGKLTIDQNILNKHTALTEDEIALLERHPVIGAEIAEKTHFLKKAVRGIRHHHERWDGGGYPDGLRGKKIPAEARLITIVDAYDAMVTRRSYGKTLSDSQAVTELQKAAGTQFDPEMVEAFVKIISRKKKKKQNVRTK